MRMEERQKHRSSKERREQADAQVIGIGHTGAEKGSGGCKKTDCRKEAGQEGTKRLEGIRRGRVEEKRKL
jgi:hypothetical protein